MPNAERDPFWYCSLWASWQAWQDWLVQLFQRLFLQRHLTTLQRHLPFALLVLPRSAQHNQAD